MKKRSNTANKLSIPHQNPAEFIKMKSADTILQLTEFETLKLIHELEVHQIELELQNKELLLAKEQAEEAREKYAELYDFAPSAYFTLSEEGEIIKLNLYGAELLCKERSLLINRQFGFFVSDDSRLIFNQFLHNIFKSKEKASCEIALSINEKPPIFIHINGILDKNEKECLITAIDISERKTFEDELKESETKYLELIENSLDAIVIYVDEKIVFANEKCLHLIGYESIEEIKGKAVIQFVHPDYRSFVINRMKEVANNKKILPLIEEKVLRLDGSAVEVEVIAIPIQFNKTTAVQLIIRDITERKQTKELLLESEGKYKQFYESIMDAVVSTDINGKIISANRIFQNMLGYSLDELVNINFLELTPEKWLKQEINIYTNQLLKRGYSDLYEKEYYRKDKSICFVEIRSFLIKDEKAQPTYMWSIVRDITDRKEVEQTLHKSYWRLESIIESTHAGTWEWNIQTGETVFNKIFAEIIGYTLEELAPINIKKWRMLIHPDDLNNLDKLRSRHFNGELPYYNAECRLKHKNGHWVWIQDRGRVVTFTEDGKPLMMLGAYTDISDRKQTEEELTQLNEALEERVTERTSELLKSNATILQTRYNYETFFNTIDEFLFVLDERWNIIHSNITAINRLGYPKDNLYGKSILELHPIERQDEASSIINDILNGKAVYCPVPIVSSSGLEISVETRVSHGFWDENPVIFVVSKDISQIILSEEKFSKVFYINPSACGITDLITGKYVEVNEAFYTMFGFGKDEVIGKTAQELGILTKEISDSVIRKTDNSGNIFNVEANLKTKTGEIRHVMLSAANINLQNKKFRFTVVNDITKRKQAEEVLRITEEKFRTVADYTYDWEYWLNPENTYNYISPSCERVSGYTKEEFIQDSKLIDKIIYKSDFELWEKHNKEEHLGLADEINTELNFRIVTKTGKIRWIDHICRSIYSEGKYLGTRASNRDITEKIKIENELLRVTVEVEERERNQFSRELHDGMGPLLSTIKLYFQWLSETDDVEKIKIITEKGNYNIESAIQTIREMSQGLSTLFLKKSGYVDAALNFTQNINDLQAITINFKFNTKERFSDFLETTLYRITTELIKNTISYAHANIVEIVFSYNKEKNMINFVYTDDGIGFDLASIKKTGKGLGLMNIQQRIKIIRGNVKIETGIGKGLKVYIKLPTDESIQRFETNNQI